LVELEFTLARAGRVFLVARGPEPSCRVAAVQRLNGHKGTNTVDFTGRMGERQLEPGTYLLSLSEEPRFDVDAPTTGVRIVSERKAVPVAERDEPTCEPTAISERAAVALLLRREREQTQRDSTPTRPPAAPAADALPPIVDEEDQGVAGVRVPLFGAGPVGDSGPVAMFAVAAVIAALLLTLATLVVRFLRGSWNP
jgi:hypothetical protein